MIVSCTLSFIYLLCVQSRIEVSRRRGKLDLSFQEDLDDLPEGFYTLHEVDQVTINSAGLQTVRYF